MTSHVDDATRLTSPLDCRLRERLRDLALSGLTRAPPRITDRDGVRYRLDGHPVVCFCSNDYLGLADEPALRAWSAAPVGAGASRLVCGDLTIHRELELELADHLAVEAAMLFPSGFQLNVGVLPALLESTDHVVSDALNHASLIDGLRLAKTSCVIVPHLTPPNVPFPPSGLSWWVTEAIFSMDGDCASAPAMCRHLERGGCLYLDEAHSFGLFPGGRGYAHAMSFQPTVFVGTLGKALGCAGAFVAGTSTLVTWLKSRVRSFVFSTGVSPLLADRIRTALTMLRGSLGEQRREQLWHNADGLCRALELSPPSSPIIPLHVGANELAMSIAASLVERGFHVQAIRPPTVPPATARLRVTVSSLHTGQDIERFAHAVREVFAEHSLVPRRSVCEEPV